MRKLHILFYPLVAVTIFWCGCEAENAEDVNQERIKTYYTLEYDAKTERTTATAEFVFGSTDLILNPPSGVFFNDKELEFTESDFLGKTYYSKSFTGLVESGIFQYINSESKSYSNQVDLTAPINIPANFTTYSKSNRNFLTWSGAKLNQFETVTVTIRIQNSMYYFSTSAVNANALELTLDTTIPTGLGSIEIERKFDRDPTEAPEAGGLVSSYYRSLEYSLTITE